MRPRQTTLRRPIALEGVCVHAGAPARVTLRPADADAGIAVSPAGTDVLIPARWTHVVGTAFGTRLGDGFASVGAVEHVLAALAAFGVDNAVIEVEGPEVPILDGSAAPFVEAIARAGVVALAAPRRVLEILKPVRVSRGDAFAELRPAAGALTLDVSIDFADPAVGRQRRLTRFDGRTFRREIARARTFGFANDAERLWRAGFALGSSPDNTVVIARSRVVNAGGLRFPDEFVRHKTLDAIGDLALAGAPIRGAWRSHKAGHALHVDLLRAVFADRSASRLVGAGRTTPAAIDLHA